MRRSACTMYVSKCLYYPCACFLVMGVGKCTLAPGRTIESSTARSRDRTRLPAPRPTAEITLGRLLLAASRLVLRPVPCPTSGTACRAMTVSHSAHRGVRRVRRTNQRSEGGWRVRQERPSRKGGTNARNGKPARHGVVCDDPANTERANCIRIRASSAQAWLRGECASRSW